VRSILISHLQERMGARLLTPESSEYDRVRQIWNGMHDRHPALIARCLTASEVAFTLRQATSARHPVTVRGGGHHVGGLAIADDAIMIDLSLMRNVTVNPVESHAQAQGGCLLRDVDSATAPYGMACPAGVVSHTGLGGLTLGGGYGWLAGKWGLTCDHIISAQVVLADGSIVEATEDQHADLLWALRGGGGNFGAVTRFKLRLRPVGLVRHEIAIYSLDNAAEAIEAYRDFAGHRPADLQVTGALKYAGNKYGLAERLHHEPVLVLTTVWHGHPERAAKAADALFGATRPMVTRATVMTYTGLQTMADYSEPHGNRYFTKSCYLADMPRAAGSGLVEAAADMRDRRSSIDFEYLRGAILDTPADFSAFPARSAPYICTASAQWSHPDADTENISWARRSIEKVQDFRHGVAYANYDMEDSRETITDADGARRDYMLAAIKNRYDPYNLFRGCRNPAKKFYKDGK
jgi:FAD/FMN-containing dehydrogenase